MRKIFAWLLAAVLAFAPISADAQSITQSGGGASAVQPQSGYPFFLPTLFGSGVTGACTLTTTADVGYLGSFGVKQCTSASLAAGQTLTIATGASSGALILGGTGTCTFAGTITANGAAGLAGLTDGGGAGGATAGGGVGGAKKTTNGNANDGVTPTLIGHGSGSYDLTAIGNDGIGYGAGSGAYEAANITNASGRFAARPLFSNSATVVRGLNSAPLRLINPSKLIKSRLSILTAANGTASTSGTVQAIAPTTNDYGPWAAVAGTGFLDLDYIPPGPSGFGGGVTGVAVTNSAGGGGGGGGGVVIIECNNIVLTAGYSITATGGAGGNGFVSGVGVAAGGSGGCGGVVILVYHTLTGSTAAITAAGGAAGTGAGTSAAAGLAGTAGAVYLIQV